MADIKLQVFQPPVAEGSSDVGSLMISSGINPEEDFVSLRNQLLFGKYELSEGRRGDVFLGIYMNPLEGTPLRVYFFPVSFCRIEAYLQGFRGFPVTFAAVEVFPFTKDGFLVFGGPGMCNYGTILKDKISQIGGYIPYSDGDRHPIFHAADSWIAQTLECRLTDQSILGHYSDNANSARTFVVAGSTDLTASDLLDLDDRGLRMFNESMRRRGYVEQRVKGNPLIIAQPSDQGIQKLLSGYSRRIDYRVFPDLKILMDSGTISEFT
ncbi:hypothetical protein HYU11_06165 [Candidatus Woesearchaeota archaeon]|nr:hypothetical protein [Candidatus Woesearchaeota archaeon]